MFRLSMWPPAMGVTAFVVAWISRCHGTVESVRATCPFVVCLLFGLRPNGRCHIPSLQGLRAKGRSKPKEGCLCASSPLRA